MNGLWFPTIALSFTTAASTGFCLSDRRSIGLAKSVKPSGDGSFRTVWGALQLRNRLQRRLNLFGREITFEQFSRYGVSALDSDVLDTAKADKDMRVDVEMTWVGSRPGR
jgi:hypothetical protein